MWYLCLTVITDVLGLLLLARAQGFSRPWYLAGGLFFMLVGFVAFSFATKSVPPSVANAVWCGMSVALVALGGRVLFGEPVSMGQYGCLCLIMVGTVGLSLLGKSSI